MNKIFLTLMSILLLTACGNNTPQVITKTQTEFTQLPKIQMPPPVTLIPFKADMPRDMSTRVIKDTPDCKAITKDNQNDAFWAKCGEHPIILNSNIYLGFDLPNWNILQENLLRLQENDIQLRSRIETGNKSREEISKLNQQEQQRLQKELSTNK